MVEIAGSEAEKREIALAANYHRLNLHPVEQYEAFAGMARYKSEEEIAAHFRLDVKDVKKSLALGRLAPEIRAAWKAGELSAEAAQAYTIAPPAQQVEVFRHRLGAMNRNSPSEIRRILRGDAVIASASIAIFARDEYIAAGGPIQESLFEEKSFFDDGPLLRRLAETKLRDIAERIRVSQGWGFALTSYDDEAADRAKFEKKGEQKYLDAERKRIDEIEERMAGEIAAAERAALSLELEKIELRSWTRGIDKTNRAQQGFILSIDSDGELTMEGGLARIVVAETVPPEMVEALDIAERDLEKLRAQLQPATKQAPPPVKDSKPLRAMLDTAIGEAVASCAKINVNLALALAVAALGSRGASPLTLRSLQKVTMPNDLLDAIASKPFDEALRMCIFAPVGDLAAAMAACIARSVNFVGIAQEEAGRIIVEAGAISNVGSALDAALDRKMYFDAASKEHGLSAIRELLGEAAAADAAKMSRAKIAEEAARVTKDRAWLPYPLSSWVAEIAASNRAAEAQTARDRAKAAALDEALEANAHGDARHAAVARFLSARVARGDGLRIKAGELHEAFVAWCVETGISDVPALAPFAAIMKALGVKRFRTNAGTFYLGLSVAKAEAAKIAAE